MKPLLGLALCLLPWLANAKQPIDLKAQLTQAQMAELAQNNAQCGYWQERLVQVCDQRTVPTQVPFTRCEYNKGQHYGHVFPATLTTEHPNHLTCPQTERRYAFLGAGSPEFWANYVLSSQSHLTRAGTTTEQYNCRDEYRYVWVGGQACH